jgi:hypothetical protein
MERGDWVVSFLRGRLGFSISSAMATSSRGESSSAPPLSAFPHQEEEEGVGVGLGGALSREQSRTMRSVTPPVAGRMVPPLGSVNGVGVEVAEGGRRKSAASDDGHGVHLDGGRRRFWLCALGRCWGCTLALGDSDT